MRERDIRNAIHDALMATNQFSDVYLSGLPENYGYGVSQFTTAVIEPVNTTLNRVGWDAQIAGGLDYTANCSVTLLARDISPQVRDERVEMLLEYLKNAINGISLANFTLPGKTWVSSWRWAQAMHPERRITATVSFEYIETWQSGDTTE